MTRNEVTQEHGEEILPETPRERVIKDVLQQHIAEIMVVRAENPDREPGGFIKDGDLSWSREENWLEIKSESGEFWEEVRREAEAGAVRFHCHPQRGFQEPSATDYVAAHVGLGEVVFTNQGIYIIIPKEVHSLHKIRQIEEFCWVTAEKNEWGEDAYWHYAPLVKARLACDVKKFTVQVPSL